ncbi:uncharacterized protein DUF4422 [Kineothrix alysoides]|uniref:Uncharacterized protein DUF4422 n=1 Tax=Kineothrix alysoides TaxID=1469948 RepID=A0A4R1QYR5_9FIRM|nr:DUF4422 domain-containing protein [Kineothrix alysoides]TCL58115.1 uncharacterized protein DUF4422 [Kineothrix alysoides]
MEDMLIFGAKSLALGACIALNELYPQYNIKGFVVSSLSGNPTKLHNLPVIELNSVEDKRTLIYIATPEDVQGSIVKSLKEQGFDNYICMDSEKESELMGRYYDAVNRFPSLEKCGDIGNIHGYIAKYYKDKPLIKEYRMPMWLKPIQVGAVLTNVRVAGMTDDTGDNISGKNGNYCELTALYWIWKNVIPKDNKKDSYYGLFHYRRVLDVKKEELYRLKDNGIDVILPYPTICDPHISEHHERYVNSSDWKAMLQALAELQPDYFSAFMKILEQEYLYNYNILIARKEVISDYCAWLFPILERTEQLSVPKGSERSDRYIGYLGENLLTLYFMYHKEHLHIVHTGRIMLV